MSSRVSMDFPRNGLAQALELGLAAEPEDALDYAPLLVQQHRVGEPSVVIYRFHVAAADQNREGRPELGDERAHLAGVHVVGNCRDVELIAWKTFVQLRHVRELLAARRAPRCPEIHECDLAAIIV